MPGCRRFALVKWFVVVRNNVFQLFCVGSHSKITEGENALLKIPPVNNENMQDCLLASCVFPAGRAAAKAATEELLSSNCIPPQALSPLCYRFSLWDVVEEQHTNTSPWTDYLLQWC